MYNFIWRSLVVVSAGMAICGPSVARADAFPDPSRFGAPTLVPGISGTVSGVTITPDGRTMVFDQYCAGTWRMSTAQRDVHTNIWGTIQPLSFPSGYNEFPSLSPDGKWLTYCDDYGTGRLMVAGRDSTGTWANPKEIKVALHAPQGVFFDGHTLYVSESTLMSGDPNPYLWHKLYQADYDPSTTTEDALTLTPVSSLALPFPRDVGCDLFGAPIFRQFWPMVPAS